MKKYIIGLFLVGFLLAPGLSFAQGTDTDPNPNTDQCVNIVNNLRYRDRDVNKNGEVSTLQDFLQSRGYLNSEPTGYLGLLTFKAVKDFQKSNGISPTGYVGSVTIAMIKTLTCGGTIPPKDDGCLLGQNYSSTTGEPCNTNEPVISEVSGSQSLNINQTGTWKVSASSVTVLSPNGGETWVKDTSQAIKWQDNETYTCEVGMICAPTPRYYDINLVSYYPPCSGIHCPAMPYLTPFKIAQKVSGVSYAWNVGSSLIESNRTIPDGSYTMQVCRTGTETCDSSDSYFKIVSSSVNTPSIHIVGSSGNQVSDSSISVNMGDTFTISGMPKNLQGLSYYYGSGYPTTGYFNMAYFFDQNFSNNNLCGNNQASADNTWIMTCTAKVAGSSDFYIEIYTNGQIYKSNTVAVKILSTITGTPSITVLSPNGGETYVEGQQITISWETYNIPANTSVRALVVYNNQANQASIVVTGSGNGWTNNDGQESIIVPTLGVWGNLQTQPGLFFKLAMEVQSIPDAIDSSDNLFTINSSTTTTFPPGCTSNSGYSLTTGQTCASGSNLVSYWYGKVNQHISTTGSTIGSWVTDPDGVSGADLDMLTYCKKWFPNSTSVVSFMNQTLINWQDRGNVSAYASIKMAYSCVQGGATSSVVYPTTLSKSLGLLSANALNAFDSASSDGQNSQTNLSINTNNTQISSCGEITITLKSGMNNSQVKCLQKILNEKGFKVEGVETGKETTYFGPATLAALKVFQSNNKLIVDGILGPNSRAVLKSITQ